MDYLINPEGKKMYLKKRVHSEMKTCEKLAYYPNLQPITLIFAKSGASFPNSVSVSKGLASQQPRTFIRTSKDLHQSIQEPASEHPHLYKAIHLHHTVRTCIILP